MQHQSVWITRNVERLWIGSLDCEEYEVRVLLGSFS